VKTLRLKIPSGDAGADVTARALRQLIEYGKRDPRVRRTAISVIKSSDVTPHDQWGEVRALHGWVQRNVRYVKDPYGIEYVQTPDVMLSTMTGDCDDYTVFLGSLLESVGYPVDVKIVARNGRKGFHHVYPIVHLDGLEVGLDASIPVPFGFQSSDIRRQQIYRSELNGMRVTDVYGGSGLAYTLPAGITVLGRKIVDPGFVIPGVPPSVGRKIVDPGIVIPGVPPSVGGCSGVRWLGVVLQAGKKITERCIRERIASGKIKAASGCELQVMPTVDPTVHTVISIPIRAIPFIPPPEPDVPVPSGMAKCDWPHGRGPIVLHRGESRSGHCVRKFLDMRLYRPAEGCRLIYEGPVDPTQLPGPVGKITCVPVGYDQPPIYDQPPQDIVPGVIDPDVYMPEYEEDRPYLPGVQPPTIVTVPGGAPGGYPVVAEAGFPTWAIIGLGLAVLLPMLMKGK